MLRCHPQRSTLCITRIGEPDAVAPEDRQHSFKHVAQLPQTLRALHSAADLVHAFQKPETVLPHCVGAITFDDDFVAWFHKMPYFAHIVGGKASNTVDLPKSSDHVKASPQPQQFACV